MRNLHVQFGRSVLVELRYETAAVATVVFLTASTLRTNNMREALARVQMEVGVGERERNVLN